jgi:hypothetical protein
MSERKIRSGARWQKVKQRSKVQPGTGLEDPEGELKYTSTLSLTSALYGGGW